MQDAPALRSPSGAFAPFASTTYRSIWFANLASNMGTMVQSVAAAWLMTDMTRSHQMISMVQVSGTIPLMLLGMFAGAIADNYNRRRIMLVAQMGMVLTSSLLAILSWTGHMTPWLLLGFTLSVGTGMALNSPAWQASVRQQVGPEVLPQAIALNAISFNLARCVGPALGGLLISVWNVSLAFAVNATSYLALIVVLLRWHPQQPASARQPILPAIAAGLRFCAGSEPIRRILMRGLALGFGVAAYQALVPAVVRGQLHGTEIEYGVLLGLFGIGSVTAALFITSARRRFGTEAVVTGSVIAFVVAQIDLANAHSLLAAAPATFIAGAGWVTGLTTINTVMQMRSPDEIIGRCLSIYQAITFGGMAIGAWVWGTLADYTSLGFSLHASALFLLVSLVALRIFAPLPELHKTT